MLSHFSSIPKPTTTVGAAYSGLGSGRQLTVKASLIDMSTDQYEVSNSLIEIPFLDDSRLCRQG